MMNSIVIDGVSFSVVITYKNIKNTYLRVKKPYVIDVSSNRFNSISDIKNIILSNRDFIIKSNNKLINKLEDERILYLGRELNLVISDKTYIDNENIYASNYEDACKYIDSLCIDVFTERLNYIKSYFNKLPNFSLRIRKMKSRWGVCNKRSYTVTLNTELIKKNIYLIDYVIVHELCHFKYMNHSALFWNEVSKYYPNYKEARKELNRC